MECKCGSKKSYAECCGRFHIGSLPSTALELMRSRYSAYALNLPSYIMDTTHPGNPSYQTDRRAWAQSISQFSLNTSFEKLEILDFQDHGHTATVTFTAHLTQNDKDVTFTEKSIFEKVNGKWLYKSGTLAPKAS